MRPDAQGRCLCGAVRFKFDPEGVAWRAHCHCESCRRACSAPLTTWFGVRDTAWRWSAAAPARFTATPGVVRSFCGRCGTPMAYQSAGAPGETRFYAASLDDSDTFAPTSRLLVRAAALAPPRRRPAAR